MRCPLTPEDRHEYRENRNPEVARHLAGCAACRAEEGRLAHLERALSALPEVGAPAALAERVERLAAEVKERALSCDDTRELLEAWRDGDLDAARAFLVEDHLLWCAPCAKAAEAAEQLTEALRALPVLTPPAAIAERIAAARVPWWQRLMPAPAPSLGRAGLAMGALAAALLFAVLIKTPHRTENVVVIPPSAPSLPDTTQPVPADESVEVTAPASTMVASASTGPSRRPQLTVNPASPVTTISNTPFAPAPPVRDSVAVAPPAHVPSHDLVVAAMSDLAEERLYAYDAASDIINSREVSMLAADEESLSTVRHLQIARLPVPRPQRSAPARESQAPQLELLKELGRRMTEEVRDKEGAAPLKPITTDGEKKRLREGGELTIIRTDI